ALEAKALGDLNGDHLPDAALVLHMRDPRNRIHPSYDPKQRYDTNPRMLVVVLVSKGGGYDLAASDHKLIPRRENPNQDEPFGGVSIANGALHVKLTLFMSAGGWRMGSAAFTLRWQDDAMRLIGYDADWVQRNSGETEKVSVNYLTGRLLRTTGSIENDEEQKTNVTLPRKPLLTLNQIGDGLMFEPGE
ncbi:MAG TPA: hypothetical protein VF067_08750, partial [Sphingomicrobium sp.]